MNNKKSALIKSLIALLLCFSMLVGTTFAWFTDSVTTGINTIAAGNLDVELYHSNAVVKDERVSSATKLFKDLNGAPILWEPGVVSYENLRVTNDGDMALAYRLAINTANENFVVETSGAKYGLSQILKVGVVEGGITASDRASVVASVDAADWTSLSDFMRSGSLLPEGAGESEQTWGVVVYWEPGENDNFWNLNNGKQLSEGDVLTIDLGVSVTATQEQYESDSFGDDYDANAKADVFPDFVGGSANANVVPDGDNKTSAQVEMRAGQVAAVVPAGVQLADGTTKLELSVTEMNGSGANIELSDSEAIRSLDVHIKGVADTNTVPMTITIAEAVTAGLNMGNYKLYHVEGDGTKEMKLIASDAAFTAHNQFKYDPATGDISLYMATFSEVALVADTENAWEGKFDYTWYDASKTELTIANADQLAAFGAIVGGMKKVTGRENNTYTYSDEVIQDSFKDKTIRLISDIDLGDDEEHNVESKIFYPIGYYNSEKTYERTKNTITSGLRNFEGTFDGNGHTIANFYQNTWEMKGDNNYYDASLQYFRDGMGLFGRVYKGTVKNLTVDNFSSDGEYTTTGVIAAYADGATFENIAITNCNPRVYNIGNGGIVGCVGWYAKEANLKTTFKNITVDNSNKISALWGSYDVACGGIVGQYYPTSGQTSAGTPKNAGIHFENCHVAAQMDVYNDVCANYQYYAYRYTGMLIGSVRENVTIDGHVYPKMDGITAKDCTVHFGTWNDYYYCEFEKNGHPSYSGPDDYKFSRVPHSELNFTDSNSNGIIDTEEERASVTGCKHKHTAAEDNQAVRLPFNNLVTGYGWGVTTKVITDYEGVENMDITAGDHEASVVKFKGKVTELANNKEYKLSEIFTFVDNGVGLVPSALTVAVNNLDENNPVSAEFKGNTENWENGTLKLTGTGKVQITIQDYYFCTPTTINVDVKNAADITQVDRFSVAFPNENSLNRVGNSGTVALGKLFTAEDDIGGNVTVTFEAVQGDIVDNTEIVATKSDWATKTVQFKNTGIVRVTISDDNFSNPLTQYLEVVDATNVTGLSGTISGNVVLLNDCELSSLTVSGRNTVYGNGFTATYTGNGQYLKNGLKQGVVTVSENGKLDNLRIKASIYPSAYLYYEATALGEYVQGGPSSVEGDKTRYHYQLSSVVAKGNATISNCHIYGGRTNVFVDTGNVTITDTILECGTVANMQIQSNSSHTITLNNLTTIQYQVHPTIGDTSKVMLGAGIIVGPETTENPTIVLNGYFKQYNWVTAEDEDAVSSETTEMIINAALDATEFNHTINGTTASNLGIIYMNTAAVSFYNNTGLPYEYGTVSISTAKGQVYSLMNATANQIYSDSESADKSTENDYYEPQFKYSSDLGGQYVEKTDDGDEYCCLEGDTIKVMFPAGDNKELNLTKLVEIQKYSEQNLNLVISVKDESGNVIAVENGKINLSAAGKYFVTYTVTDTVFYDKDGNMVGSGNARAVTIEDKTYSWTVTIEVSLKDTKVPDARFEFDATKQKMGYYKPTIGDVKQYLPFLAGLKIYDYNGQTEYLRFDGSNDFDKVASVTIVEYKSNEAYLEIKLTDGGEIKTKFLARADSGGGSTYTGKIKTSNNTIYFVNDGGTSNKDTTTTAAYWYVDYYKFIGNNGVEITSAQQTFNSNGKSASTPSGNFSTTIKYTVTYDVNGGNCGQSVGYATSAATALTLPTPTRSGYIFAGWYTAASGGTRVGGAGESYTPSANITLYAQWGKPCTVTFNANGGSCGTASEKYSGTALTLPTPTRDGYWFVGWYDAAEGGNKVGDAGATYNPRDEITLYAHWQEKVEYTVTYNANGGSCGTASATYQGTALTLPTPTRTGYTFNGWYTAASGGTKIGDAGASYTPGANITLYAQWTQKEYTITVSTSNATVTGVTNNQKAHYGDTISVTVSFSQSNKKTLTVKDASDNNILSESAAGTYTFTMPASNVTISASSEKSCVTSDTLITLADGSQKRIDEVTYNDQLLVWNFFEGKYDVAPSAIIFDHGSEVYEVLTLKFADGTEVKTINGHGFFDVNLNEFVFIDTDNVEDYIGHKFAKENGARVKKVKLVDYTVTEEFTGCYSIQTAVHINFFTEGMFSETVPPFDGWFEYFEIGEGMKYDEAKMQADIEKYGLYEYSDFAEYVTYEQFIAFNGPYLKVLVGRGVLTFEQIFELIATYVN